LRRLPDEEKPELLGWFAACLLLSAVVAAAFLFLGDISSPAKARLVALPAQPAANVVLAASACREPSVADRRACRGAGTRTALAAGQ